MSAFRNIWKIPELRTRILFTLGLILLCRFIAIVPTPGLNPDAMGVLADTISPNAASSVSPCASASAWMRPGKYFSTSSCV